MAREPSSPTRCTQSVGKKIAFVAGAFALSLLCAAPAGAKVMGLHHVEVTGPGIDGKLVVSPEEFGRIRSENSPAAIALEGVGSPFEKEEPRPRGPLGPRFVITYVEEYFVHHGEIVRLTALLYPYVESGPVTFVLPDQRKDPFEPKRFTRAGWLPYPEELVENLRTAGLPSREVAERAMETDPSRAWPWLVAGVALASVLWVAGSSRGGRRDVLLGGRAGHDDRVAVGVLR